MARARHGHAPKGKKSPEYCSWYNMIQRCTNRNNTHYDRYGGRGITVCDRWRHYPFFLEDMGSKPSDKHTIERINNDGNYEPGNCRWATRAEQSRNTAQNRMVTYLGETLTLTEWAERLGVQQKVLAHRLDRGWPLERALTKPANRAISVTTKQITHNGQTKTISQWAECLGVNRTALSSRIRLGWDVERALTQPFRRRRPAKSEGVASS